MTVSKRFILEWTKLVWAPALGVYIGMDKTNLDTSSGSLFVRHSLTQSGCPRHVERKYIPLFCVAQSNVDLRYYVIRAVIVI